MPEGTYSIGVSDERALCPTAGHPCPARENLVSLYTEQVGAQVAAQLPVEVHPSLNGPKLSVKLSEMTMQALARHCEGIVDGQCATRAAMDESRTRRTAITGIRKLIHRNK